MSYLYCMSKQKDVKEYESRHNIKFPNTPIKVIERKGRIIYFDTEFGICKRPIGSFGRYNFRINSALNKTNFLKNQFIKSHGYKYDYTKVIYNGGTSKVKIICKKHGEFEQNTASHIFGRGCPKCGFEVSSTKRLSNTEIFIDRSKKIHNNKYNYNKVNYVNNSTNVIITCNVHGDFKQLPNSHLLGRGCHKCGFDTIRNIHLDNPIGWTLHKWKETAKVSKHFDSFKTYIIECWNKKERFYKIGRTFTTIDNRFKSEHFMPYSFKIVKIYTDTADVTYNLETKLKKMNKNNKYKPMIKFGGMTECFSKIKII